MVLEKDGQYLVKRIAAIPGDIVCLDDHTLGISQFRNRKCYPDTRGAGIQLFNAGCQYSGIDWREVLEASLDSKRKYCRCMLKSRPYSLHRFTSAFFYIDGIPLTINFALLVYQSWC